MPPTGPTFRPRPSGGFNPGGDQFGEALDESALQQAVSQKQLGQAQAVGAGNPQGIPTGTNPLSPSSPPPAPREVGTITEELVTRPAMDIAKGLRSLFDFSAALGITPPETKTPEEKARHQATHSRYQKLNQVQQAYAREKYQRELKKKQAKREREEQRKQQQAQQASQEIAMPSSPKNGPMGPAGSSKQRAMTKLQTDRTTLGGLASVD